MELFSEYWILHLVRHVLFSLLRGVCLHTQVWAPWRQEKHDDSVTVKRWVRLSLGFLRAEWKVMSGRSFFFFFFPDETISSQTINCHQESVLYNILPAPRFFHTQTHTDSAGKWPSQLYFGNLYSSGSSDCKHHVEISVFAFLRRSCSYFCRYSIFKYTSIALVSVGIFICTFMSAKQVVSISSPIIYIHALPWGPRYLLMMQ